MDEQNNTEITVYDLKTRSIFKIAYFSALGVFLTMMPIIFAVLGASGFFATANIEFSWGEMVAVIAVNLIVGPAMWAVYLIFGNWVWKKFQPNAMDTEIEFTSHDKMFHSLTPDTIYRVLTFCSKGIVAVFGLFMGLILVFSLLFNGLDQAPYSLAAFSLMAVVLAFIPYIWAYFFKLGSYVTKGITARFGWGRIETL